MRLQGTWLPLLLFEAVLICHSQSRRIRVQRPYYQEEEQESVQYYSAEPQEEDPRQRVVLVSSADQYNGLYGQPTASSRQDNYISRGPTKAQSIASRSKEPSKSPPVQTIRNYNKVNDDGSFTFGYEAADGSFKEETRGTDCVVRGKYGYVDPDGNKREFTYVSGNPCDPNAPKEEQDEISEESIENDNAPANYPTRPVRPIPRPLSTIAPKPVTLFQNTFISEEEQPEPEQVLRPTPSPIRRPSYVSRPQYVQEPEAERQQTYQRPQLVQSSTPASVIYRQNQPLTITPRPYTATPSARTQLPATTYRPQLLQVAVTPRPTPLYTKQYITSPSTTASPSRDFNAEFERFQQENNEVSPTPSVASKTSNTPKPTPQTGQVYSSALVYDPATGQYNTQLYQTLPQTEGDFSVNQRIQPYVHTSQRSRPPVLNIQQLQQQSPLYTQSQVNSQAAYQAQQAGLQFQNSAQLYAQQQRVRDQQQQAKQQRQAAQPPVYYIQPSVDQTGALATSQIDAFLRGHNIQF